MTLNLSLKACLHAAMPCFATVAPISGSSRAPRRDLSWLHHSVHALANHHHTVHSGVGQLFHSMRRVFMTGSSAIKASW